MTTLNVTPGSGQTINLFNPGTAGTPDPAVATVQGISGGTPVPTTPSLPTGAATSAKQDTEISSLATIATNTTGVATAANQTTANSSLSTIATNTGNITHCDTTSVTVTTLPGTLPLPTGAATAANQSTSNTSLATIATNTGNITHCDTTNVTVTTSALPTGAATAANQTTSNTSLATIATNTGTIASTGIPVTGFTQTVTPFSDSVSVGLSAVQLPSHVAKNGAYFQSLITNAGKIYLGTSSGVTTSNGFLLSASSFYFALNNTNQVWAIADTAAQTLNILGS